MHKRKDDVALLYAQLEGLAPRSLYDLRAANVSPAGVYFFFEPGGSRSTSGRGPRIVRIGTHALTETSKATLWQRLGAHRGRANMDGGNHRGSIFRLLVGDALRRRNPALSVATWGAGASAPKEVREAERELEIDVSRYISSMSVVWLSIGDRLDRACVEQNAIALLSNYRRTDPLDPPSGDWLGHASSRERVRNSGLWNNMHVDAPGNGGQFIPLLEQIIARNVKAPARGQSLSEVARSKSEA